MQTTVNLQYTFFMGGQQFGPYELVRPIASGGMAELYLVKALGFAGFEKFLALKVIHPDFASDVEFVSMLVEEAKLAVQLQHGNIAQTFDLGRVGDIYYIAMEFVDGVDLYRVLRYSGDNDEPLPLSLCAYVAREALHGLDYAHRKTAPNGTPLGIVHRDVSPQNILVSYTGEIKLVDFGIAKASMRAKKTAIGVLKGKYYYMSPEQAWGESIDARSDIFSMGIVLYELLVGQMLFVDDDLAVVLEMVRKADIKPPSHLRPDIPPALDAIVMRALAKRPDDRFRSAIEFAGAIDQFLRTMPLMNAVMLSDYIRHSVAPGAAPLVPTRDDGQVAVMRQTVPGAALSHTTPMRVRQASPPPAQGAAATKPLERKISSYAETNRIRLERREIEDSNSLIFTETDIGRDGGGEKLEAAREQFRRESFGASTVNLPAVAPATIPDRSRRESFGGPAPVAPQPPERARRASEDTAMRMPAGLHVPTPKPLALPTHLTSGSRPALSSVPPPRSAASSSSHSQLPAIPASASSSVPVFVPAPASAPRSGWTTPALAAWMAAFAALGVAVAIAYAWYQIRIGPARAWVDASASDAIITLDGGAPQLVGGALALRPGVHHTVMVRKPGYQDIVRDVMAERGQTVYVMAVLQPIAQLTVAGPEGFQVLVNGKPVGTTPLAERALEVAGVSLVEATSPSGARRTWVVNFDQTPAVHLELPRDP